ncbi:hypothetical protein D3C71_1656040 [compost metagenome]
MLLLHAIAGLAGDGGRLVGGVSGLLQRALDLGNHRLELVEEAVEAARELAEFVFAGVVQAAGQVAFAAGDIFQAGGHGKNRPGHAAGGQPYQQQAEYRGAQADQQADQVSAAVMRIEALVERDRRCLQHRFGQLQQHLPGGCGGDGGERPGYAQHAVCHVLL